MSNGHQNKKVVAEICYLAFCVTTPSVCLFSLFLFEHERGRKDRERQPVGLVEWVSSFGNSHCTMCLLCVCVCVCVCHLYFCKIMY